MKNANCVRCHKELQENGVAALVPPDVEGAGKRFLCLACWRGIFDGDPKLNIIDWKALRAELGRNDPTRERTIRLHWAHYLSGNPDTKDNVEDMSRPQMEEVFSLFRAAWILSTLFNKEA